MLEFILTTIHVLVSIFLILVVLLQQGKGADLSVFGGGGTQAAFGARGAATILHKMTVFGFISFVITTILIGVVIGSGGGGSSVMDDLAAGAATEAEADALDADAGALDATVGDDATAGEGAPAIGVGASTSSPGIEVEAEPVGDAAAGDNNEDAGNEEGTDGQ